MVSIDPKDQYIFYCAAAIGLTTGIAGNLLITSMFRMIDNDVPCNVAIFGFSVLMVGIMLFSLRKALYKAYFLLDEECNSKSETAREEIND